MYWSSAGVYVVTCRTDLHYFIDRSSLMRRMNGLSIAWLANLYWYRYVISYNYIILLHNNSSRQLGSWIATSRIRTAAELPTVQHLTFLKSFMSEFKFWPPRSVTHSHSLYMLTICHLCELIQLELARWIHWGATLLFQLLFCIVEMGFSWLYIATSTEFLVDYVT